MVACECAVLLIFRTSLTQNIEKLVCCTRNAKKNRRQQTENSQKDYCILRTASEDHAAARHMCIVRVFDLHVFRFLYLVSVICGVANKNQ